MRHSIPIPSWNSSTSPEARSRGTRTCRTWKSTQILCQLSSVLEYLHNQNPSIGHRDIKPENILVVERTADGILVKFGDFGLSKAADTLKTCCGTARFAAPEIYLKMADAEGAANNTYSVAVDIWSLGVVVASLMCGWASSVQGGVDQRRLRLDTRN